MKKIWSSHLLGNWAFNDYHKALPKYGVLPEDDVNTSLKLRKGIILYQFQMHVAKKTVLTLLCL